MNNFFVLGVQHLVVSIWAQSFLTEKFDNQDAKKSGPKSVMSLHLYTLNPLYLPTSKFSKDLLVDLLSSSEVVVTLRKTDAKMKWHRLIESTGT